MGINASSKIWLITQFPYVTWIIVQIYQQECELGLVSKELGRLEPEI